MKSIRAFSALALYLGSLVSAAQSAPPVPEDYLVLRCEPAVFMVLAIGNIKVTSPASVSIDWELLESQYHALLQKDPNLRKTTFFWLSIGSDPDTYLREAGKAQFVIRQDVPYQSGTAFAVNQGIFLTNAHVVSDAQLDASLETPQSALTQLREPLEILVRKLESNIGDSITQQAEQERIISNLLRWLAERSHEKAEFHYPVIIPHGTYYSKGLSEVFTFIPCNVIKMGEAIPGKDIAVLQVALLFLADRLGSFGSFASISAKAAFLDNLVCLPLGDSDDVLPGARVHAFGFPGAAYITGLMTESAKNQVTVREGELGTTKGMLGGWNAFTTTVNITHGDSGGPIIDKEGAVVAISVGGSPTAPGFNIAIPINLAKEFLKSGGVDADPGWPLKVWQDALKLYAEAEDIQRGLGKLPAPWNYDRVIQKLTRFFQGSSVSTDNWCFIDDHVKEIYMKAALKSSNPRNIFSPPWSVSH